MISKIINFINRKYALSCLICINVFTILSAIFKGEQFGTSYFAAGFVFTITIPFLIGEDEHKDKLTKIMMLWTLIMGGIGIIASIVFEAGHTPHAFKFIHSYTGQIIGLIFGGIMHESSEKNSHSRYNKN